MPDIPGDGPDGEDRTLTGAPGHAMIPSKTGSRRNDDLALAFLAATLHRDREGLLTILVEAAQAGGTWNVLDLFDAVGAAARDVIDLLGAEQAARSYASGSSPPL